MKTTIRKLALVAAALCCASAWAAMPDGLITSKAKLSLWTKANLKSTAVHVDTNDGVVTLYGKVPSVKQKATAEKTVRELEGVREVRNMLQVVVASEEKSTSRSDAELKAEIKKALEADGALADSRIEVKSVDKGVALLSGTATTFSDQLAAVKDADQVPGVRSVASEMRGPTQYGTEDRTIFQRSRTAKGTPANSLTDTRITAEVKLRLLTTAYIPSTEISVDTNDRVVTLFGIVPTDTARRGAEDEAAKVSEVRRIVNDLQVVPTAKAEVVSAQDKDLKEALKLAYRDRPELKGVSGEVKNGVILLTGTVDNGWDRLVAVRLARQLQGTKAVEERLTLRSDNQPPSQF